MQTLVFYDGECGLCHRSVLFLLARDPDGTLFRYAPLSGTTFETRTSAAQRVELPDSLVVLTADGRLLERSVGVFYALKRIGGFWGGVGAFGGWFPTSWTDWGYDRVAAVRKRWFARPTDSCPLVPAELRSRFDP